MEIEGLEIAETETGLGIIAEKEFKKGIIIFEVLGRLIPLKEIGSFDEITNSNTFRYSETLCLSPEKELGDFLNHSCDPNAYVHKERETLCESASEYSPRRRNNY